MSQQKGIPKSNVLQLVGEKIDKVSKIGFGEIKIVIRNGVVYRILSTEDELVDKNS